MLRIFSRIRLSLIGSLTGRYLLYAMGEILLVVIGILIALQVNNWNEKRVQSDQIEQYLINLIESLEADIVQLESTKRQNASRCNCFKYILQEAQVIFINDQFDNYQLSEDVRNTYWFDQSPEENSRLFIDRCFIYSSRGGVLVKNTTALDEFKSTGLFSYISDDSLKRKINYYYQRFEWHFSSWREQNFRERTEEWHKYVKINHNFITSEIALINDPITLVKENKGLQLEIKELMNTAEWRSRSADMMLVQAESLVDDIRTYLKIRT